MAPRKRKAAEGGGDVAAAAVAEDGDVAVVEAKKAGTGRVTRSSTRRLAEGTVTEPNAVKEKAVMKKKKVKKEEVKAEVEKEELKAEAEKEDGNGEGAKTVVIEHCKQCNSFKTRAIQVKDGLESAIDGIQVLINPEKPRKGCFEIRRQDGEIFISLLDMKRPFPPLKALDMEEVISDIIEKIK